MSTQYNMILVAIEAAKKKKYKSIRVLCQELEIITKIQLKRAGYEFYHNKKEQTLKVIL